MMDVVTQFLRSLGVALVAWADARELGKTDERTDDEIRARPRPGDWWIARCGFRAPVLADLNEHQRVCVACRDAAETDGCDR
jgi:hypothetical protein